MDRHRATLVLLGAAAGCRIDQGLTGKDAEPVGDSARGSVVDTPVTDTGQSDDSGRDTAPGECVSFAPAAPSAAVVNDACGLAGVGDAGAWSAEVEVLYQPPEGEDGGAQAFSAVLNGPEDDCFSAGTGACVTTRLGDGIDAIYRGGTRAPLATTDIAPFNEPGTNYSAPPAWTDADADGNLELNVVFNDFEGSDFLATFDSSGSLRRSVIIEAGPSRNPAEMLTADLDGDGHPEVVTGWCVVDAVDLRLEYCIDAATSEGPTAGSLALADVDLDGRTEIFLNGRVFRSDGTEWWEDTALARAGKIQPFIIQADGDPEAEVGWVGTQWMLYDDDGVPLFDAPQSYGRPQYHAGPVCVGDFDGDGVSEAAWADGDKLVMVEMDGTLGWTAPADTAGGEACSGWDVDADGALEILFADRMSFRILDGRTGETRIEETRHHDLGIANLPVVADVDNDGHAEILFATGCPRGEECADWGVIAQLGNSSGAWPAAGPAWPSFDYAVRNISPEGFVPSVAPDFWNDPGTWRGRLATDDTLPLRADLVAAVTDVCAESCEGGSIHVALQAGNRGPVDVPSGFPYAVYALDGTAERLIYTGALPDLPAYGWAAGWEIELSVGDLGPNGLRLVVDDDGAGRPRLWECDEGNNAGEWSAPVCP